MPAWVPRRAGAASPGQSRALREADSPAGGEATPDFPVCLLRGPGAALSLDSFLRSGN